MYTFKSHYCQEGEQREICLLFSLVFAGSRKGLSAENVLLTGRNDRLKPGTLLNLTKYIGDKLRQFSISLL